MEYRYHPRGTCSREIIINLKGDTIQSVKFIGGCDGNTKGIAALVKGMNINDVKSRLSGIRCGMKLTSCPDQLAKALSEAAEQQKTE